MHTWCELETSFKNINKIVLTPNMNKPLYQKGLKNIGGYLASTIIKPAQLSQAGDGMGWLLLYIVYTR